MGMGQGKVGRLSGADQSLLRWFFGPGASAFERSPFGATLERARMYDNREARIDQGKRVNAARQARVKDQRAKEEEAWRVGEFIKPLPAGDCEPTVTAHITAETKPAPAVPDNEESLMRAARASRGLQRLTAHRGDGYTVMALAFGPGSEVWQQNGFLLGGLFRMTEPGKELIRRVLEERAKSQARLSIQLPQLMHNDYRAAEATMDDERVALYGAAEGAAARLLGEMASVWNDLHRGEVAQ